MGVILMQLKSRITDAQRAVQETQDIMKTEGKQYYETNKQTKPVKKFKTVFGKKIYSCILFVYNFRQTSLMLGDG